MHLAPVMDRQCQTRKPFHHPLASLARDTENTEKTV
jgi:hypothetical protein